MMSIWILCNVSFLRLPRSKVFDIPIEPPRPSDFRLRVIKCNIEGTVGKSGTVLATHPRVLNSVGVVQSLRVVGKHSMNLGHSRKEQIDLGRIDGRNRRSYRIQ